MKIRYKTNIFAFTMAAGVILSVMGAWAGPPPAWAPSKVLLEKLAPAVTTTTATATYQIQPPKGYTLQTVPGPGGSKGHAWVGEPRADGIRPWLMFVAMTPPAEEKTTYTLAQVSAKMLEGVQRRRKDWKQSSSESGTVNGIPFIRTYWRGTDTATGLVMHGFSYVAQEGKGFIQLSSQDVEPQFKTTLALTEASVLTFQKQQGKSPNAAGEPAPKNEK